MVPVRKNKGQVTLFIIAGVAILVVFSFLFMFLNFISENKLNEQRERLVGRILDATVIQRLTSVCVDDALKTGLVIIGRQGGEIYEEQLESLSSYPSFPLIDWDGVYNFGEWIKNTGPSDSSLFIEHGGWKISYGINLNPASQPPLYPCFGAFNPPSYCLYPYDKGNSLFGRWQLPQLEIGAFSIEGKLERYIETYVRNCVGAGELQNIEELAAYDISVTGDPEATLDLSSPTEVVVAVDYPVSVLIDGEESITQFLSFEARESVRLRQLYAVIRESITNDVRNINFNMFDDIPAAQSFSFMAPPVDIDTASVNGDDIFIFKDSSSLIEAQPYVFNLARHNRPPALEYINRHYSLSDDYDYLLIEDDPSIPSMLFEAKADDPDEDEISYSYSGDFGNGVGNVFSVPLDYTISPPVHPPKYYYSQRFTASDGMAEDYQDVRVLIDRKLEPAFMVKSPYKGFDGYISKEDFFIMDASDSAANTLDPNPKFSFDWTSGLFTPLQNVPFACMIVPENKECSVLLPEKGSVSLPYLLGADGIDLVVKQYYNEGADEKKQKGDAHQNVQVVPCIPYRNPSDDPYPYNSGGDYGAPNACCMGDISNPASWKIAASGTECYRENVCLEGQDCYVYYTKVDVCYGTKGNICGDGDRTPLKVEKTDICGTDAAAECIGALSYQLRLDPDNSGWCYGTDGCKSFCEKGDPMVDIDGDGRASQGDRCSCIGNSGKRCDENADGRFDGVCGSGVCSELFA